MRRKQQALESIRQWNRRSTSTMKSPYHSKRDSKAGVVDGVSWSCFSVSPDGWLGSTSKFVLWHFILVSFLRLSTYLVECWLWMVHWEVVIWFRVPESHPLGPFFMSNCHCSLVVFHMHEIIEDSLNMDG